MSGLGCSVDRLMFNIRNNGARPAQTRIPWPEGKDFAFTVFDDTDLATLANVRPVYDFLARQGLLTTKSVWPLRNCHGHEPASEGMDCQDPEYLQWVLDLQAQGFEIGLHGIASGGSLRDRTHRAWVGGLEAAGFLKGPSNFGLALSKTLAAKIPSCEQRWREFHFNRGDGDGPINL